MNYNQFDSRYTDILAMTAQTKVVLLCPTLPHYLDISRKKINKLIAIFMVGESRAKKTNFCLRCHSNERIKLASVVLCQTCKYDRKLPINDKNTPFDTHTYLLY